MAGLEGQERHPAETGEASKWLFWTCFVALVATSFGFIIRANIIGDLGLSVGVIGAVFLGNIQDRQIDRELLAQRPALHAQVAAQERVSVFGKYQPVDKEKVAALGEGEQEIVAETTAAAKKNALMTVAIFPVSNLLPGGNERRGGRI